MGKTTQGLSLGADDDPAVHRLAAEMDILLGRLDDAKEELQRAAKLNPGNPETEYLLG